MYNPKSLKAEEFICHDEVLSTLEYAENHKNDVALIDEIIAKAKERKGLSHREASVCLPAIFRKKSRSATIWQSKSKRIFMETAS